MDTIRKVIFFKKLVIFFDSIKSFIWILYKYNKGVQETHNKNYFKLGGFDL